MKSKQVRTQQVPMKSVYPITFTSDYTFIRSDYFFLFSSYITLLSFYFFLGILFFRVYNSHRIIGRKNIRKVKKQGFISVANHCHIFDTVLTGVSLPLRRARFASAQRNFEAPYFRKMFRLLRGFPIPESPFGLRRITEPVVEAVKQGKIVHFFPEQELWHLHQGIDHFQKGAFYLAHIANCPVVPIVHLFRTRKFFGKVLSKKMLSIKTIIGEPIYPRAPKINGTDLDSSSVQEMCDTAQNWMKAKLNEYHQGSEHVSE